MLDSNCTAVQETKRHLQNLACLRIQHLEMDRCKRQACFLHNLEILLEGNVSEVPYLTHYLLDRFVLTEAP